MIKYIMGLLFISVITMPVVVAFGGFGVCVAIGSIVIGLVALSTLD